MRTETFSGPKRGRNTKLGHAGIRPLNSPAKLGENRWGETESGCRSAPMGRTDDPGWTLQPISESAVRQDSDI
jgi:hypothetical protein